MSNPKPVSYLIALSLQQAQYVKEQSLVPDVARGMLFSALLILREAWMIWLGEFYFLQCAEEELFCSAQSLENQLKDKGYNTAEVSELVRLEKEGWVSLLFKGQQWLSASLKHEHKSTKSDDLLLTELSDDCLPAGSHQMADWIIKTASALEQLTERQREMLQEW